MSIILLILLSISVAKATEIVSGLVEDQALNLTITTLGSVRIISGTLGDEAINVVVQDLNGFKLPSGTIGDKPVAPEELSIRPENIRDPLKEGYLQD